MAVDFTRMSNKINNAFDTDYMDIYRQIDNDPERDLLYSNVKCHIAIKTSDNPDPNSVDTQPIITSLRIHCGNWVDLKNNDYIVAKKCDLNGNILNYYQGIIGEPATSMARQSVTLAMKSDKKGEEPEPVPTTNTVDVVISYYDISNNNKIHENITQSYRIGDTVVIKALNIDNYTPVKAILDNEEIQGDTVTIVNIQGDDYILKFYYQAVTAITHIRMLVNGDYTKDNGTFAYGLHLYAPISVLSVESANSIKLASNKFTHEEIGVITIKKDDKFKDNLGNWHIITNITQVQNGYLVTFADTQPVECYETHWYN